MSSSCLGSSKLVSPGVCVETAARGYDFGINEYVDGYIAKELGTYICNELFVLLAHSQIRLR